MQSGNDKDEKQTRKRTAFDLMNNVRDLCEQSDAKKLLLFTLATYCDGDGICYPSNETLASVTRKSRRTVQRMLKGLVAEGELEILESGIGRDQKRILYLKRYAVKGDKAVSRKGDKAMTSLNATRLPGETCCNSHSEQPQQPKGKGRYRYRDSFSFGPKYPYPESEEEMYDTLEKHGIQPNPVYDGQFFQQMQNAGWQIDDKPVFDWLKLYQARVEVCT